MSKVELNTDQMLDLSGRLKAVVTRGNELADRFKKLDFPFPVEFAFQSIFENNGETLSLCASYLKHTAQDYEKAENRIKHALETGQYEIERIKKPVPTPVEGPPSLDKINAKRQEAIDELYKLLESGRCNSTEMLQWLMEFLLQDEDTAKAILDFFGINGDVRDAAEFILKYASEFIDYVSTICELTSMLSKVESAKLGPISSGIAGLALPEALFEMILSLVCLFEGAQTQNQELLSASTEYLDSSLTTIANFATSFIDLAGWQGAIAGIFIDLGCDYSINKITNMMESIMRGDSYWESVRHAYLDSAAETANDYIFGSAILQLEIFSKVEVPIKETVRITEWLTGVDVDGILSEKSDFIETLLNTDNWGKELYEFIDKEISSW